MKTQLFGNSCLAGLLVLFALLPLSLARRCPVLRVQGVSDDDKTGCYIVSLKKNTSHEKFQEILSRVVHMSDDAKVYGSVERVAKAFTVRLSDYSLNAVSCEGCLVRSDEDSGEWRLGESMMGMLICRFLIVPGAACS